MSDNFNSVPFPTYEGNVGRVFDIYLNLKRRLLKEIYKLSQMEQTESVQVDLMRAQQLLRNIDAIFNELQEQLDVVIPQIILDAYIAGQAVSILSLQENSDSEEFDRLFKSLKNNVNTPTFKNTHAYRVHKIMTDTQQDLLRATQNTKDNVKKLVREVVAQAMREKAAVRYGRNEYTNNIKSTLNKRLLKEKLNENEIAIIDKAGRRWKLETYINMVSRTKQMAAFIDGIRAEGLNNGVDLGVISSNPTTVDACKNFEGMVISLNGLTSGYPTYEELRATKLIFHPNCRHFIRPVRDINLLPKEVREQHDRKLKNYRNLIKQN